MGAAASPADPDLPRELRPMLALAADGPLDSRDHVYEVKWDGMRVLVGLTGERLCLRSRNGLDATARFPEVRALRAHVRPQVAVLDGEIVRMVGGAPSFADLQRRIQAADPRTIAGLARSEPVELIVFDLLRDDSGWVLERPWEERRARLERSLEPGGPVQLSPVWPDGRALWQVVRARGLEGVIAKQRRSRYRPGARDGAWLKIKTEATLDVVVGGWTEGAGERGGELGALLVGLPAPGGLRPLGHVGTGFSRAALLEARALLEPLADPACPFHPSPDVNARPHWVRPERICEVRHQGWSGSGKLRAPVFVRWRPDLSPGDLQPPASS